MCTHLVLSLMCIQKKKPQSWFPRDLRRFLDWSGIGVTERAWLHQAPTGKNRSLGFYAHWSLTLAMRRWHTPRPEGTRILVAGSLSTLAISVFTSIVEVLLSPSFRSNRARSLLPKGTVVDSTKWFILILGTYLFPLAMFFLVFATQYFPDLSSAFWFKES